MDVLKSKELQFDQHDPSVIVQVGAVKVDAGFMEKMDITGIGDTQSQAQGLLKDDYVERRDNGDGTFLQVLKLGYEAPQLDKKKASQEGYPIRIEVTKQDTVNFVFSQPINGKRSVEISVDTFAAAMGTQENPFILDSSKIADQLTALARLVQPYMEAGHNVGIYAVLPPNEGWKNEDGSHIENIYFANKQIPTLDIPLIRESEFPQLFNSMTINTSTRTISVDLLAGTSIAQAEEEIKRYGESIVKPYAEYFNTSIQIVYGNDRVLEYGTYQRLKPTGSEVLKTFIAGKRKMLSGDSGSKEVQSEKPTAVGLAERLKRVFFS